jgi:hypothetical protein
MQLAADLGLDSGEVVTDQRRHPLLENPLESGRGHAAVLT